MNAVQQESAPKPRGAKVSDLYEIREGDLERDADDILRLWRFLPGDNPPQREKLDWYYRNNPAGAGTVLFLSYKPEQRNVGVVCLSPREFVVAGERAMGSVFGDFAVEPEHRSLGPALKFQKDFLQYARERSDFIFGFPNPLSGKVRSFGGHKLGYSLDIYVLPLDFTAYLKSRLPGVLATLSGGALNLVSRSFYALRASFRRGGHRVVDYTPEFMNGLWQSLVTGGSQIGRRDAQFVDWRIKNSPNHTYDLVAVEDRHGHPVAFAALRAGVNGALIVEDMAYTTPDALRVLVDELTRRYAGKRRSLTVTIPDHQLAAASVLASAHFRVRDSFSAFVTVGLSHVEGASVDQVVLSFIDNDV